MLSSWGKLVSARKAMVVTALAVGAFACGSDSPSAPSGYTVLYRLSQTGTVVWDSLQYDDGSGTMIKVSSPSSSWSTQLMLPGGSSVEARAWGTAFSGSTAVLRAEWVLSGVASFADRDSVGTSSVLAAYPLSLHVKKHTL